MLLAGSAHCCPVSRKWLALFTLILDPDSCEIPSTVLSCSGILGPALGVTVQVSFLGGRVSAPQLLVVPSLPMPSLPTLPLPPSVCEVCLGLRPARFACSDMAAKV